MELVPATQNRKPLPPEPVQDLTVEDPPVQDRSSASAPLHQVNASGNITRALHTPLSAAFRFVEPTWRNYIVYVDLEARAGNADARRYLECWQALSPSERRLHWPEQLCELAIVHTADLVRWVAGQAWQEGATKAAMCMTFMRDRVLEKSAEFAMSAPENFKHAELFMKASGLLPASGPRGGGPGAVNIFTAPMAANGSVVLSDGRTEMSPTHTSGLRSMDEDIVELSKIMQTGDTHCAAEELKDDIKDADDDDDDDDEDGNEDED